MEALFEQESGNRHTNEEGDVIRNPDSGATGVGQIMPLTAWRPGGNVDPLIEPTAQQQRRLENLHAQREEAIDEEDDERVARLTSRMRNIILPLMEDQPEERHREFAEDYLNAMLDRFGGNVEQALAAYNWGAGNVEEIIDEHGEEWATALPTETANYIPNVGALFMRGR